MDDDCDGDVDEDIDCGGLAQTAFLSQDGTGETAQVGDWDCLNNEWPTSSTSRYCQPHEDIGNPDGLCGVSTLQGWVQDDPPEHKWAVGCRSFSLINQSGGKAIALTGEWYAGSVTEGAEEAVCPQGTIAVGVRVWMGCAFNGAALICASPVIKQFDVEFEGQSMTTAIGDTSGNEYDLMCPVGMYLTGIWGNWQNETGWFFVKGVCGHLKLSISG